MKRPPRRALTYVLWSAGGVGLLAIAAVTAIVVLWDPAELASALSTKLTARTGREVSIEGPVSYKLAWAPTVSAERVRIANAPWGTRPDMLSAARVDLQIALLPLLGGDVRVRGVSLIEPDLLLEVDRKGRGNWQLDSAEPAPSGASQPRLTAGLARLRIERGSITYINAASGRKLNWVAERLGVDGDRGDTAVFAEGRWNDVAVKLEAQLPPIAGPAGKHRSVIDLIAPGVKIHAEGVVPLSPSQQNADFTFSAKVDDWKSAAKLLQRDVAYLPALSARGSARMDASSLVLEPIEIALGKSSAKGRLELVGDDKARQLALKVDAPQIDLAELLGKEKKRDADGRIFSADPLPTAWLQGLSGKAEGNIARLTLRDGRTLGGTQLTGLFENGVMRIDPMQLDIAGKPLRLRLRADARDAKRLGVDLAVDGQSIPFGALASLLDIPPMLEGSAIDIHIRLNSAGNSIRALMAAANADVRVVAGPGRLRHRGVNVGADVTEILKTVVPSQTAGSYTELQCAVARLPVRGGVARIANSIALETSKVDLIAAGTIDLRNETLDLGLRTKPASGLGVGLETLAPGIARLRGPLAKPDVQVDLSGAAKAAAHIGLAAATGGLSLIASGLLAERVPDKPCQAALSGKAATVAKPAGGGSVVDDLLGGVKKLFGG